MKTQSTLEIFGRVLAIAFVILIAVAVLFGAVMVSNETGQKLRSENPPLDLAITKLGPDPRTVRIIYSRGPADEKGVRPVRWIVHYMKPLDVESNRRKYVAVIDDDKGQILTIDGVAINNVN